MKTILALFYFTMFLNKTYAQELQSYIDEFDNIVKNAPTDIYVTDKCENLMNRLNTLSGDLENILNASETIHPEDVKILRSTKSHAEALEAFLGTVGTANRLAWYLSEKELMLVEDLFSIVIVKVHDQKYCCNLFEIKFNDYVCLLALIKGSDEIYNIKSKISYNNGLATSNIDMGLTVNKYRKLWSNGDDLSKSNYKIISIICTVTGHGTFRF